MPHRELPPQPGPAIRVTTVPIAIGCERPVPPVFDHLIPTNRGEIGLLHVVKHGLRHAVLMETYEL
jgi:hypothetical protein